MHGERSTRPHWAGLDGARGLAVVAVLLFHAGFPWARGGFLGVSLFFTLSGFLITGLLVRERSHSGSISLPGFWARRARRLLPASILALGLAIFVVVAIVPPGQRLVALGDVRAAAVNLANWRFIWRGAPYADVGVVPSPVQHYWSLAIEEQFYLVFPLVALLALRRHVRGLATVLGLIVIASTWRQMAISDPTRVYFGTDTRMAEIAIGGLLALSRESIIELLQGRARQVIDAAGAIGLAATVVLWAKVPFGSAALMSGGLSVVAVVSALVIFAAVDGPYLSKVLSFRPLAHLGVISYGVYLFHFPIYLLLAEPRVHLDPYPLLALRLSITLAISLASFHLLERPVRIGQRLRGQRSTAAFVGGLAVVLLVALVGTGKYSDQMTVATGIDVAVGPTVTSPEIRPAASPVTVPAVAPAPGTPPSPATDVAAVPIPATPGPVNAPPPAPAPPAPNVVIVGDSTAEGMGDGLKKWGASTGRLQVTSVTSSGCATYSGVRFRVRNGYEFTPKGCDSLFSQAVATANHVGADAFLVLIGSSQLADWTYSGTSGWHSITEPSVGSAYQAALSDAIDKLSEAGIPILWANVLTPAWDIDAFSELIGGGGTLPGSGSVTLNDPQRAAILNGIDSREVRDHPMATILPWKENIERPDGSVPESARADGLHIAADQIPGYAESWLMAAMQTSYQQVVARHPQQLRAPRDQAWSRAPIS